MPPQGPNTAPRPQAHGEEHEQQEQGQAEQRRAHLRAPGGWVRYGKGACGCGRKACIRVAADIGGGSGCRSTAQFEIVLGACVRIPEEGGMASALLTFQVWGCACETSMICAMTAGTHTRTHTHAYKYTTHA
jgi:hypothetical protein